MSHVKIKIAVIDLGTNTFHTVIFEKIQDQVSEIYRKRHHVFLSENGIETIAPSSIQRAKVAIADFKEALLTHKPDVVRIIGTEALRVASNGKELSNFIENELGTQVEIISGVREAELIAKGVQWELQHPITNGLIMDIGGGSVEFIHVLDNQIKWLQSFPVGVGVLYNQSKHSEPILDEEIESIYRYIDEQTSELSHYLSKNTINLLIGSSGSFELIPSIQEGKYPPHIDRKEYSSSDFHSIYDRIIRASLEERQKIEGLPPVRAQLIVVAFTLMNWIMQKTKVQKLQISKFAVKEGLVKEELDKNF